MAENLAGQLGIDIIGLTSRRFPDGETYLRIDREQVSDCVIVVASLEHPDEKALPLIFAADLLREFGAKRIILVAPYLAYMRQDKRFEAGEAITSLSFAYLLSEQFDALITVEPHLHRHADLNELYAIPSIAIRVAPELAAWVQAHTRNPLLIGPDSESKQWVREIANQLNAPYVVLKKIRQGDREVSVSLPDIGAWPDRQPVIVDDIISTGQTMIAAIKKLVQAGFAAPDCIGVHAIFAEAAYQQLAAAGGGRIVTTDSITHHSNAIGLAASITASIRELLCE